jgi:MYXO-CTERM domain-containing protein
MRRTRSTSLALLILIGGTTATLVATDVKADWPPPKDATSKDMADPKNWPNDPGYAFSADSDGAWNFYSFMPDVVTKVRPQETASGMSIDLAWRNTIGDDRIHIAVTDSGIKWDEADLVEKIAINEKELVNHKPLKSDGSACGGTGALAGFDCNGDGILSISDYKDTPNLLPEASMGHPKGDRNNNGILDPGDLILNYSDGVDDDGNGYIDDIAGWDFMKDDNDPYDDTRYGHGTGEANDSTAQGNNGNGSIGVCPLCRVVPTRVGDSFIANVNAFGKAVVYATDNGVSIVQCALGTINYSKFSQSALDYAYSKGVLTVTSMADENARHHNMPASANHTLPVHAIEYDGSNWAESSTFVAFHPCSNFGAQNLLSASGTGCSSEATGRLSGISGLLFSAALQSGLNPPLNAAEAQSIFFTTADDINIAESQSATANYKWSQEGFDQRFGYGRVNANKAVEAVLAGKIPPAVDVTSPTWFSVLYKDHVTAPIDITGTVSAKRATSFDYVVEWGPGVQPLDGDFKQIKQEMNVPGTMVVGTDGPLASLDIRTIDTKHTRDVDSPNGENDDAITVRVRAVAHYGGQIGDVRGEMRRSYFVHQDPDIAKGFPIFMGGSGEMSPKMADLDGDGTRELIVTTANGEIHAYKLSDAGPTELPGFPFLSRREDGLLDPAPVATVPVYSKLAPAYQPNGGVNPDLGRESFNIAPGIADLDGDGKPEIVATTFTGTIYVIGSDGKIKPGFPRRLPEVPSCSLDPMVGKKSPCMDEATRIARGAFAAPVLADMNKDGKLDIIQAAFDGNIYVFDAQGVDLPGFPVTIHYKGKLAKEPDTNRILSTPAVADFNGDGIPDILVGSNERLASGGQSGGAYLVDGRGSKAGSGLYFPNWPVTMTSFELFPLVAEGIPNAGVIGTFEGKLSAVMHGNASLPLILPFDPGVQHTLNTTPPNAQPQRPDPDDPTQTLIGIAPSSNFGSLSKAETPNTMLPLFAQPSLGDLDQDGVLDVVTSGGSLNLAINLQSQNGNTGLHGDHLLAMWSGKTGNMMPASPLVLEDYSFFNSQAIADLNGDGYPEVITGSGGYFLHAWDACGREPEGWPKFTGQWIIPTPAVGDVDGDKKLEVAVGTRDGWLYVWHTKATTDSTIEWESFHHDNRNTGNYDFPLEQGGKKKAAKPLTEATCLEMPTQPPVATDKVEVSGGCRCSVGERDGTSAVGIALGGLALLVARRRRNGRSSPRV